MLQSAGSAECTVRATQYKIPVTSDSVMGLLGEKVSVGEHFLEQLVTFLASLPIDFACDHKW